MISTHLVALTLVAFFLYFFFFFIISKPLAPKLCIICRTLIRHGRFPDFWRTAFVMPIPEKSGSVLPEEY